MLRIPIVACLSFCFLLSEGTIVKVTKEPVRIRSVSRGPDISGQAVVDRREQDDRQLYKRNEKSHESSLQAENKNGDDSRARAPAVRKDSLVAVLRTVWSDFRPALYALSLMIGMFFTFVLKESPLSPLPVPPLPHSPVGPYPPTNIYPFGVPPVPQYGHMQKAANLYYPGANSYIRRGRILIEDMKSSGSRQLFGIVLQRIIDDFFEKQEATKVTKDNERTRTVDDAGSDGRRTQ